MNNTRIRKRNVKERDAKKRFLKPIVRNLLIPLFILAFYEVAVNFAEPRMLPIKHVQIEAHAERINLQTLKKRMQPYIKGFFSTNVMALKTEIQHEPFVDEVLIIRVWPDTLRVNIKELTLIANWNNEKAVSSKGELIAVKIDENKNLPLFQGPENQVAKLLAVYNEFSKTLRPLNLAIAEVNLNLRHSWYITLDNGIKLCLGRKDLSQHLQAFMAVYPQLRKLHGNSMESIDLRHTNGVSVQLIHS